MLDPANQAVRDALKRGLDGITAELSTQGLKEEELKKEIELTFLALIAEYGRRDFFFFCTAIMGAANLNRRLHGDMCDFMQTEAVQKMMLIPRGHLKSTLGTVYYALWRIVRNPDIRILIANYKLDNAKAFVSQMRGEFTINEMFRACYSGIIPDPKKDRTLKWNESALTVLRRSNPKEATVECTGVGNELTSKHYDLAILDDLVGPENIGSKEQLDLTVRWWNQLQFLLEPGADQVIIGTRWHFEDLYGFIEENQADDFKIFRRDIYADPECQTTVWPEKFTLERIRKVEEQMSKDPKSGRSMFMAQYRNMIVDEATAYFKRGETRFYEEKQIPNNLGITISVDPAISEKETADCSAVTVRGIDSDHKWWILECWQKRGVEPKALVDKVFEIYQYWSQKYDVQGVGVETVAYQKALQFLFRDEQFARGVFLPFYPLNHGAVSKEFRVKGLIPHWQNGAILVRKNATDSTNDLLDQLYRYPRTTHDDLVDSLAMHLEIPASVGRERKPRESRAKTDRYGYPIAAPSGGYGFNF